MAFKGVTVLDIGSSAITAVVGEKGVNGTFSLKGQTSIPYEGFSEGHFFDEKSLESGILEAVKEALSSAEISTNEIYVSVPGVFISLDNKKYKIAFGKSKKITQKDIDKLFEDGKVGVKTDDYEIIGATEIYFVLDDSRKVFSPIGVNSSILGGAITYVSCEKYFAELIRSILAKVGIKTVNFVYVGQAEAEYLLTREERDFPSLILDVGYITSEVSLHYGNGILAEYSEDFGGGYLMGHLVGAFDLSLKDAESLKRQVKFGNNPENNAVYSINSDLGTMNFACESVNDIIFTEVDAFLGGVTEFIDEYAKNFADSVKVYLTGGGISYLKGIKTHVSARLDCPVEILVPKVPLHSKPEEASLFSLIDYAVRDKLKKKKKLFFIF